MLLVLTASIAMYAAMQNCHNYMEITYIKAYFTNF